VKRPARGASYPFALWPVRTSLALRSEGQGSNNRSIQEMARPSRMVTLSAEPGRSFAGGWFSMASNRSKGTKNSRLHRRNGLG
jgi:hypothetical protein